MSIESVLDKGISRKEVLFSFYLDDNQLFIKETLGVEIGRKKEIQEMQTN